MSNPYDSSTSTTSPSAASSGSLTDSGPPLAATQSPSGASTQDPSGSGTQDLAAAQRDRDPETVGATANLGSVRRVTADELDPHRAWTVQSGTPFPQSDQGRTTRFNPVELPDPQKAVDAGLMPVMIPPFLLDDTHVTQPPSDNPALDHPLRLANQDNDPGYAASQATSVTAGLEAAQAQRELTGTPEDRDGTTTGTGTGSTTGTTTGDTAEPVSKV